MLLYDITDDKTFESREGWIRNMEEVSLNFFFLNLYLQGWRRKTLCEFEFLNIIPLLPFIVEKYNNCILLLPRKRKCNHFY